MPTGAIDEGPPPDYKAPATSHGGAVPGPAKGNAPPWDADVALSMTAAGRLIERQFPSLAPARLEPLGAGWDNVAYLVNGHLVFRFPRRALGARCLEQEVRILPTLATHLPLPVPVPRFAGEPADGYPYPFAGYEMLLGTTACRAPLTEDNRVRNAVPLARFLSALHGVGIDPVVAESARDELGRSDLRRRIPMTIDRLNSLTPLAPDLPIAEAVEFVQRLSGTPVYGGPKRWVHGDLYACHLLLDDTPTLCGVIDWGDVHAGDPSLDLSIAFTFLPPDARGDFQATYCEANPETDEAAWDRARIRALFYGAVLTEYGIAIGDRDFRLAGEYALRSSCL